MAAPAEDRGPGEDQDGVIDLESAIPIAVVVGVVGVIVIGAISWYLARRAAAPLAAALEVQRSFVADASHELRTPLTTLTSRIQLAQHRAQRGGDVDAALVDLRRDAAVMDAVLTDLLRAAESAGSTAADGTASAPVATAARDAVQTVQAAADAVGADLVVDVPDVLAVAADPAALQRALTALLDNAVKAAPPGSTVAVSATASGRTAEIRVVDQGAGIVGIDAARVFDRFARAEAPGESGGRRGFGLGLALVRDIAQRFGGTVRVEKTGADGTTMLLTLPVSSIRPAGTT